MVAYESNFGAGISLYYWMSRITVCDVAEILLLGTIFHENSLFVGKCDNEYSQAAHCLVAIEASC